ncbi:MAG: DUF1565 domain-containing protein, partial [Candidatus Coatesbacteria bacterium]|nr:DUF1565 domain-containing protein [Candidatus Coatesbacteria bacterium]
MRSIYILIGIICLLVATIGIVLAADYYVDARYGSDVNTGASPNWPCKTITYTLSTIRGTARDPIIIHLEDGTYSPSSNGEKFPLQMEDYVSIVGGGVNSVTIDAEQSANHVIYCADAGNLTIEGVTIRGGEADGTGTDGKGGGVLFAACSEVIMQYCTITENSAWMGGGIHFDANADAWLEGCIISGNSSIPDENGYS